MSAHMTVAELLDGLAEVAAPLAQQTLSGLTLDSRAVTPGDAFVALAGTRQHGIAFADQAAANGASCVLYDPPLPEGHAERPEWIAVNGLRDQLAQLARRFFAAPSSGLRVVGVTGTNGKTSCVQLIARALDEAGLGPCGHLGTLGLGLGDWSVVGERTTPDVLGVHAALAQLRDRGARAAAMEVSSHALDQGRVDGVDFAVAAFTNLTRDHLDYHHSMEAYGAAKARLFRERPLGAAVINIDDAFGRELIADLDPKVALWTISAGGDSAARLRARAIVLGATGIAFELCEGDAAIPVNSALLGRFNVDNLLLVAAVLRTQGLELADCARVLGRLQPVRGRMNRIAAAGGPLVVVDYAHTPDALAQALQTLRGHTAGRLICVFGCGGERDQGKRPQMGRIAEQLADRVIVTDDNPRGEDGALIVEQILSGCAHPQRMAVQRDRAAAIRQAIAEAAEGDVVLIAGKGHETYQEVRGERRSFDDSLVAARCLEAVA